MNIVVAFTDVVVQRSNALIIRIIVVDRMLVGVAIEVVAVAATAECTRTDQRGCCGGQSLRLSLQIQELLLLLLLMHLWKLQLIRLTIGKWCRWIVIVGDADNLIGVRSVEDRCDIVEQAQATVNCVIAFFVSALDGLAKQRLR